MKYSPIRTRLIQSTIFAGVALSAATPFATAQDADDAEAVQQTIVVTGSRIVRNDLIASSPVNVINAEAIEISGATNVQDILNELPAAGVPGLTDTNSNFTLNGGGVNQVNLRNLREERTLVLVNGRRHVGGLAGSPTVDLNMIPAGLIERIDVVTGGAAAVYGSDAIAGVVNIIYKDDFDGVETNFRYGDSLDSGGREIDFNITAGSSFADDKGHATLFVGYSDSGVLEAKDREISEGDAVNSSFGPFGSFQIPGEDGFVTLDRETGLWNKDFVNAEDGFDRNAVRLIRVPTERLQFAGDFEYNFNPFVTGFSEISFNQVESFQRTEPTIMGQFISVGSVPNVNMPVDNPFMPEELRTAILAADPDATEVTMRRRFTELGPRTTDQQRQTVRTVIGLEGTTPEAFGGFDWEVYYQLGRLTQDRVDGGIANTLNVYNALRTEPDGDGGFQCIDDISRSLGCVPINFFGTGTVDGDALAFVQTQAQTTARAEQEVFSASITGDVFSLPAGVVSFAAGAEYRSEDSRFISDGLAATGLTTGNTSPSVSGYYDVSEYFAEVLVPVLANRPFVDELNLEGAYRVSDYSTIGSADAWKIGATWKPFSDLSIRGGYNTAVRAPNIGELFDPGSETFRNYIDPCNFGGAGGSSADGRTEYTAESAEVQARCATIPGTATLDQGAQNLFSAGGFAAGNPDLKEEIAQTYTIGFVYSPEFLSGLNMTLDYYNITIEDGIQNFSAQDTVTQCVRQPSFPNNPFCDLIQRNPTTGLIERIDALDINVAEFEADGIDFAADYSREYAGIDWNAALVGNYRIKETFLPFEGGEILEDAGEIGAQEWTVNTTLRADWQKWRFALSSRYISGVNIDNEDPSAGPDDANGKVQSYFYHDVNVNYQINRVFDISAGIDNIFDEEPPFLGQGVNGDVVGTNTAADVYDVLGRYGYVNLRARF